MARSTIANALAWDYVRALNAAPERPVADSALDAELSGILGAVAPERAAPLDASAISTAHAAAYLLLAHASHTPDPETGRPPSYLTGVNKKGRRYIEPLPDAVVALVDANTTRQQTIARADAAKFTLANGTAVDVSARLAAIKADGDKRAAELVNECKAGWLADVRNLRDADVDDLAVMAVEQVAANGRDPLDEIHRAADAMQKAGAERFARGEFARLASDVYALTTAARKAGPDAA
jgi:hypothetical protein